MNAAVLIVGAGPTGLTLAVTLRQHGVECRVIDKLLEPSDKSKALAIHARSLEMFESMGLADEMVATGNICGGFSMNTGKTRLARVSTADVESPFPFILMLSQAEIERIMTEKLKSLGGTIERGLELTNMVESNGTVNVTLADSNGKEQTAAYAWVVGCDGAHSKVRKLLNLSFEGSAYEEQFGLADIDIDSGIAEDEVSTFFHEDGALVFFPMGNGRFRTLANVEEKVVSGDAPSREFMQDLLDKRGPGNVKILKTYWLAWFRIHRRSVSRYRVGHAFVAGDAAHIHSPVGGQGMNTGMQDAHNLAWKLAMVVRGEAHESLLDSYEEERHPIGQMLLKGTDVATKLAFLRNPLAKKVRNHMISFLSQQDIFLQRVRSVGTMTAVNYRKSPIVGEYRDMADIQLAHDEASERPSLPAWVEFARAPLPGDHAPDVMLTDESGRQIRLYEILRESRNNLLLFDGKPTEEGYRNMELIARGIKEKYGDFIKCHLIISADKVPPSLRFEGNIYLDPDQSVQETYGASAEAQYLIRPDYYIAFRSQPAKLDQLEKFLQKITKLQLSQV